MTVRERGGARGRDFYFILHVRSFGATTTRSRSLFPFLARLLATFKSASRRGCSPSSFSVLRLSWRVPAYQASLRPPQTLILAPIPSLFSSLLFLSLSLAFSFFFQSFFFRVKFTLRRPCESRCAHKFLKRKRRPAANNTRLRNYCAARNALLIFYSSLPRLSPPPSVRGFLFIFFAAG